MGFGGVLEDFHAAPSDVDFGSWRSVSWRVIILSGDVPFAASVCVAIKPMPVPPPVTRQTAFFMSKRLETWSWSVDAISSK